MKVRRRLGAAPDSLPPRGSSGTTKRGGMHSDHVKHTKSNYRKLAVDVAINAVIMFLVMYVMIDRFDHLYLNLSQFYMTLMMVSPMVIIMLLRMGSMYESKRLNLIVSAVFGVVFIGSFFLIRTQTPIGDDQFLRSMIPHHSSAILMCEEATLQDPEVVELCRGIVVAQEAEIALMQELLNRP